MKIKKIIAREILDSRGNPTVEVDIHSKNNFANAKVPSGASTGIHEALELRDGDLKRFNGKGVLTAVKNINFKISKVVLDKEASNQSFIDKMMLNLDGTDNKSNLGANSILGVSLATARLGSIEKNISLYEHLRNMTNIKKKTYNLPVPFMNIINGGQHADNGLQIQEFMIVPIGKNFKESIQIGVEVYHKLKELLKKKYGHSSTAVGDEGGFAPNINKSKEALDVIMKAINILGYSKKVNIAIDAAASEFYNPKKGYFVDGKWLSAKKLADYYEDLVKKYPIVSIEDPFSEDNWDEFKNFTKRMGKKIQVVGDDLLVTNPVRIQRAIREKSCNSLLLKVNQIGSVSESIKAAEMAINNKWNIMVSHRSGETSDDFIADLAVALDCGEIKSGAPCRSERLEKYNRLIKIEEELGNKARFVTKFKRR